jgi:pseudaminic acid cytidylyltransferase
MNICIIPARGGSKRLPRKNILEFCGKPMIAYAIEVAKKSNVFDRIIVSTDDKEISQIAQNYNYVTVLPRPVQLADDYATTVEVIQHAIGEVETLGISFQHVCCIYPTVPLLEPLAITQGLKLLEANRECYAFPIIQFPSAVQRGLTVSTNGTLAPMYPGHELTRSQDLEPVYYDAGQFYWADKNTWKTCSFIHSNGVGFIVPRVSAVDIDVRDDWEFAELLHNMRKR